MAGHELVDHRSRIAAANIRILRRQHGLSLRALSDQLTEHGVPILWSVLSKLETGGRLVRLDELAAFGAIFRVPPWSLTEASLCETCHGSPPVGFACQSCGTAAPREET